jgi:hypothetical protein
MCNRMCMWRCMWRKVVVEWSLLRLMRLWSDWLQNERDGEKREKRDREREGRHDRVTYLHATLPM